LSIFVAAINPAQAQDLSGVLPARINEASGLIASEQSPGIYWTHNDNIDLPASSRKSQPLIFAINQTGALQGSLYLTGTTQRDWEAITAARINGTPTLIVGDIGDNRGKWPDYRLWFIPEPLRPSPQASATPTALLRFRYPEQTPQKPQQSDKSAMQGAENNAGKNDTKDNGRGGFDAESLAFDPRTQALLILTKREKPARLFSLPLAARTPLAPHDNISLNQQIRQAPITTAQLIAPLPPLPAPDFISWLLHPFISPYADQPTDMALSPDGSTLAVLTYSALYFFYRPPGADWRTALTAPSASQALPFIDQWEGLSFSPDGKQLLIVREGTGENTLIKMPAPDLTP